MTQTHAKDCVIGFLADQPQWIPTLAQWFHDEWSYLHPGFSLQDRASELQQMAGRTELPIIFVATHENHLLGSCSLYLEDMDSHKHLSPWLASVFVNAAFRGRGIGTKLCRHATAVAKTLGIKRLHLFTPDQARWYATMGWQLLEQTTYYGKPATIMTVDLN